MPKPGHRKGTKEQNEQEADKRNKRTQDKQRRTSKAGKPGKAGKTVQGKARPDECKQGRTRPYDAGKAQERRRGGRLG